MLAGLPFFLCAAHICFHTFSYDSMSWWCISQCFLKPVQPPPANLKEHSGHDFNASNGTSLKQAKHPGIKKSVFLTTNQPKNNIKKLGATAIQKFRENVSFTMPMREQSKTNQVIGEKVKLLAVLWFIGPPLRRVISIHARAGKPTRTRNAES